MASILTLIRHKTFRQTVVLYAGFLFFGGCVFLGNTIIARHITPDEYGVYQLVVAIVMFTAFFFDFGIAATGARVLAVAGDKVSERRDFANLFYVFLGVCAIYLAVLFFAQWPIAWIFGEPIRVLFATVFWLAFAYPFFYFFPSVFQGTNQISRSAFYYFLQGILFLVWVLAGLKTLSAVQASIAYYGSFFVATLVIVIATRPSLKALSKERVAHIVSENKRYGFHVYSGNVVERTSFHLDKLMIAFFISNEQVAYYALGMMLIALVTTFSMAFNQSLFKQFASSTRIHPNVFRYNLLWIAIASAALFLFQKPLILLIFGEAYLPVTRIMIPLILAAIFQSLYQPYQAYLASNGVKEIKTGSYIAATINVVCNIVLIPLYGYIGAAIATCLSYFAWYTFLRHLYLKAIREEI